MNFRLKGEKAYGEQREREVNGEKVERVIAD